MSKSISTQSNDWPENQRPRLNTLPTPPVSTIEDRAEAGVYLPKAVEKTLDVGREGKSGIRSGREKTDYSDLGRPIRGNLPVDRLLGGRNVGGVWRSSAKASVLHRRAANVEG